ncbi:MAG TPA: hypothetical protein PLT34_08065 [Muribaculaceae bacterium]|jgi:hypothetical protein|nr:hypothetical protein [Muribaculaceae bacterium]
MDLDNLREQWKSLNIKVEDLQVENMRLRHDIQTNKVTSINRRLIARIRNMLLVCCLAPIFIIYMKNEIALTTATIVCYVSYFIIIGAAHGYLLWRLSARDYLSMPIAAAIKEAATLELYRKRMRMWSYIMAAPVIFMLMMDIYKYGYPGALISGIIGGLAGLAIGLRLEYTNRKLMRQIRQLLDQIDDCNVSDNP